MNDAAAPFRKDHIPALDGLRGIAVLMILWTHVPLGWLGKPVDLLKAYVHPGYLGVDLFFVLSGFLITRILLVDKTQGSPLLPFLLRRVLRIFPIYYLVVFLILGLKPSPEIKWCAFYLSNFYFPFHPGEGLLQHSWSLAVEEHFYLLWPVAVHLLSVRASLRVAACLLPLSVGSAIVAVWLGSDGGTDWLRGIGGESLAEAWDPRELIYMGTMFRAESLALGALIAYLERKVERRSVLVAAFALTFAIAAAVIVRGGALRIPGNWFPVVKLVGFTVLSGGIVALSIALHYANGRGGPHAAAVERLCRPSAMRLCAYLGLHALIETFCFKGLYWLFACKEFGFKALGLLVVAGSLVAWTICMALLCAVIGRFWKEAGSRFAAHPAARVLLLSCATLILLLAARYGAAFVHPFGLKTAVLPIGAAMAGLLGILEAARRGSIAEGGAAGRTARRRICLASIRATLLSLLLGLLALVLVRAREGWEALDSVARHHTSIAAVGASVVLLFASGAAGFVGRISYGLYLYHLPIYILLGMYTLTEDGSRSLLLGKAVLTSFVVAALSYHFLESPILRWGRRFRSSRTQAA